MKKHTILLTIFLIFNGITIPLFAENYKAAASLRVEAGDHGNEGLAYKYFLTKQTGIEGMALSDFKNGIEFHLFYLYQNKFPSGPENLQWYAGLGWHVGFWEEENEDTDIVTGPDGLIGVEYIFDKIPLALAIDWHPVYNIVSENEDKFWPMKFGVSLRYYF